MENALPRWRAGLVATRALLLPFFFSKLLVAVGISLIVSRMWADAQTFARPAGLDIAPVVFRIPLRQAPPPPDMPTPEELSAVLYGVADPSVPFFYKGDLVQDGVGGFEGAVADGGIGIAALKNELPLDFSVSDIELLRPGKVRATVLVTGPQLNGVTKRLTFVDQEGWKLQHASAMTLLQATSSAQRG